MVQLVYKLIITILISEMVGSLVQIAIICFYVMIFLHSSVWPIEAACQWVCFQQYPLPLPMP